MGRLKKKIWDWPDGWVWKWTQGATLKSRRQKYGLFLKLLDPQPSDTILDVGVSPFQGRGTNYLELWYPYPARITALAHDDPKHFAEFRRNFPQVALVFGDGRSLPFPDNHFDIVFCNAVVEHVGTGTRQQQLIHELCRVGKRTFITTPNSRFPIDSHTLIPFAHWFPTPVRFALYRLFGRASWADLNVLNLLSPKGFRRLFPAQRPPLLVRQRVLGLTHTIIGVCGKP
jgi:hypothetical protein